jgi:O-antigen/teichoic acid export membrane protein
MQSFFAKLTPDRLLDSAHEVREHLRTPLYANAYLLMLNQGISAGLGVLYWMLAARFYPPEVVGKSSAIISTLVFISALSELSLKSAMVRFVPRAGQRVTRLVLSTYGVNLLVTLLVAAGFLILGRYFFTGVNLLNGSGISLTWLVVAAMFWTVFYVQDGVLVGMRQALWVLLENSFYNLTKIILLVISIWGVFGDGIVASWFIPVPLAVIGVNILVFIRLIPRFLKTTKPPQEPITFRQVVRSVSGDHVGTLLAETAVRLLPLMVVTLLGESQNAYYYQAWLIGTMLYLLAASMASSFTVEAAMHTNQIAQISRRTLRQMALLIVPTALALLLAAPLVLRLYGKDYSEQGAALLRWLALAAVPYALNIWFLNYARVSAKTIWIILTQGFHCAVVLGLSYLWLPHYGITSIGVAWLISQAAVSLFALLKAGPMLFHKKNIGQGESMAGSLTGQTGDV